MMTTTRPAHNGENTCEGPTKHKERLIVQETTRRHTAKDLTLHNNPVITSNIANTNLRY
jgi:hypothetical protein